MAFGGHTRRLLLNHLTHFQQRFHFTRIGYFQHQRLVFAQQGMLFHPMAAPLPRGDDAADLQNTERLTHGHPTDAKGLRQQVL
ncbi:hypothetical protein D3C71_1760080 [compost metagenome]